MKNPIGDAALHLLDVARHALADIPDPATTVHLAPGEEVAWDTCCDAGGQLYVRVASALPSDSTLTPTAGFQPCPGIVAVQYGVGVLRCSTALDDLGQAPSGDTQTTETLNLLRDAQAIFTAVTCKFAPTHERLFRWDEGIPLGPNGGCAGWEWLLTVGVDLCLPCGED